MDGDDGAVIDRYVRGITLLALDVHGYYLYNAHGDVVQLADGSGAVTKAYDYDAFGVQVDSDGGMRYTDVGDAMFEDADTNPWRYCGEYFDVETNTIYLRARYYDPATGRFSSEDPIRDGLNWYTYCAGNPIAYIDPFGLAEVGLRAYAESFGANVTWNGKTGYATISYHGITESYAGKINKEGRMIIDDSVLNSKFGFSTNPISLVMDGDVTVISAIVSISGTGARDKIGTSSIKYSQQVIEGIRYNWGVSNVRVYVVDLNDGGIHKMPAGQKGLSITINQGLGISHIPGGSWKSYSDPGEIVLYQGDSRGNGSLYLLSAFGWVAAHEFGHTLGIGDAYIVMGREDIPSIMNAFWTRAQERDVGMAWAAYSSNSWQSWPIVIPIYGPSVYSYAVPAR